MAEQHALVTGPISGRIPTPDQAVKGDFVDVTRDVLYFDSPQELQAVADAIEVEHYVRGTHPVQATCEEFAARDDISPEDRAAHKKLHTAIAKKVGG